MCSGCDLALLVIIIVIIISVVAVVIVIIIIAVVVVNSSLSPSATAAAFFVLSLRKLFLALLLLAPYSKRISLIAVLQAQPASVVNFLYLGITIFAVLCSVVSFLSKMNFPIKTFETVAIVQDGVKTLAGGHDAADPVTGKVICRPQLDAEEKELYWLLENFGSLGWASIAAASGDVTALLHGARLRTLISTAVSAVAGFAALYSLFFLVTDPKWSIFATLAVITAVFSLCWTFVYISGWVDAKKLSHVNRDKLVRLVGKLRRCSGMQGNTNHQ